MLEELRKSSTGGRIPVFVFLTLLMLIFIYSDFVTMGGSISVLLDRLSGPIMGDGAIYWPESLLVFPVYVMLVLASLRPAPEFKIPQELEEFLNSNPDLSLDQLEIDFKSTVNYGNGLWVGERFTFFIRYKSIRILKNELITEIIYIKYNKPIVDAKQFSHRLICSSQKRIEFITRIHHTRQEQLFAHYKVVAPHIECVIDRSWIS